MISHSQPRLSHLYRPSSLPHTSSCRQHASPTIVSNLYTFYAPTLAIVDQPAVIFVTQRPFEPSLHAFCRASDYHPCEFHKASAAVEGWDSRRRGLCRHGEGANGSRGGCSCDATFITITIRQQSQGCSFTDRHEKSPGGWVPLATARR